METNPPKHEQDEHEHDEHDEREHDEHEQDESTPASLDESEGHTLDGLRGELQEALIEKQGLEDQYLRLRAEFDNFRRRTRQEASDLRERAAEDLVASLLPIVDNLERATQATDEGQGVPQSFIDGVDMIYKQLLGELGKAGLQKIEALGNPFDPNLHEAVIHEETDEHPDGHVSEELRTGYIFGGKVLRPSMVKVAKNS